MITKIVIRDNTKSPIKYISDLEIMKNGSSWEFKPGVNIIIGENGSGKSTLLKLIKTYLLIDSDECGRGIYNNKLNKLRSILGDEFLDGIDVYADYTKNTFNLLHASETTQDDNEKNIESFRRHFTQLISSTGEGVIIAINSLLDKIFSKEVNLTFDYEKEIKERFGKYYEYIEKHRIQEPDAYTIIMDEPDRNLSLSRLEDIKVIFTHQKPKTQIIAVLHNPILLYDLIKNYDDMINWIELTKGYKEQLINTINNLVK